MLNLDSYPWSLQQMFPAITMPVGWPKRLSFSYVATFALTRVFVQLFEYSITSLWLFSKMWVGNSKISVNATNKYISHKLSTTKTKIEAINCFKKNSLLQGIFPTQGSNLSLPHCRRFFTSWATRGTLGRKGCGKPRQCIKKQRIYRKTSISTSLTMLNPLTMWVTTNWKILKEMGITDHLTCLLRNLYAGQEGTVRTGHGITDWFHVQF